MPGHELHGSESLIVGRSLKRELEKRYPGAILGWMIILFALIAGILTDQIGDSKQVNLLAMPFVAIILWNLAMYVWLLFFDLPWGCSVSRAGAGAGWGACSLGHPDVAHGQQFNDKASLRGRCLADWARNYLPVATVRAARVWHLAAAMLAVGLIIAIYSRGFYTEYRVGWESTLLDVPDISAALAAVFGWVPITFGLAAPDLSAVEKMRFSAGGGLTGARPWLHIMASLAIALVVLPRLALATFATFRLKMFERRFPIDLADGYFQKLAARHSRKAVEVIAIPFAKCSLILVCDCTQSNRPGRLRLAQFYQDSRNGSVWRGGRLARSLIKESRIDPSCPV